MAASPRESPTLSIRVPRRAKARLAAKAMKLGFFSLSHYVAAVLDRALEGGNEDGSPSPQTLPFSKYRKQRQAR